MANKVAGYKKTIEDYLNDDTKPWTSVFTFLEDKTKCGRFYIFLGLLVVLSFYLVFGYAAQLLCNTLATAYPAYASMKAIESPQTGDDTKWLTYWTVYALFTLIDYPCDLLLNLFPFYWLAKCIFMTWLFLPGHLNGSIILYNNVIRSRFLKHEKDVDNIISKVAGSVTKKVMETAAGIKKD